MHEGEVALVPVPEKVAKGGRKVAQVLLSKAFSWIAPTVHQRAALGMDRDFLRGSGVRSIGLFIAKDKVDTANEDHN